jgi:septum formation protein
MKQAVRIVLASASPRRREILEKLGLAFEVRPSDVDETQRAGEEPRAYVVRLAEEKARACQVTGHPNERIVVLGSDTTVVLDDVVLGKPADLADSERMLRALRGREHIVHTAVAALVLPQAEARVVAVSTRVRFRAFSDLTLARYVASREGMDKAGSYGIQELGAGLVAEVSGSYSNVVGLPAAETLTLLEQVGALPEWP